MIEINEELAYQQIQKEKQKDVQIEATPKRRKSGMAEDDKMGVLEALAGSAGNMLTEVYKDGIKPSVQAVGSIVALPFQAIDAALSKPKLWVAEKQYNYERTKELLAQKMKDIPQEDIVPPPNYVAVPALQQISYCYDSDELRDMYANLLTNSMNKFVQNGVHPGFVEIIKQLCPDEAKILRVFFRKNTIPVVSVRGENEKHEWFEILSNFSDIGFYEQCECPADIEKYFDNLIRLGLIEKAPLYSSLTKEGIYERVESSDIVKQSLESVKKVPNYNKSKIVRSYISLTSYGRAFCRTCLTLTSKELK